MRRVASAVCIGILLTLISCENKVEVITTEIDGPLKFRLSQFPNKIGTSWTYEVYDSIARVLDTVVVHIVGLTVLPNNKVATLWQITSRSGVDTQYVFTSGDTLRMSDDPSALFIRTTYVFPLQEGKGWRGGFPSDTVTVMSRGSVTVPVGRFDNAFELEERWGFLNDYGRVSSWLVPNVGLVRMHVQMMGFSFGNSVWELTSFAIPER